MYFVIVCNSLALTGSFLLLVLLLLLLLAKFAGKVILVLGGLTCHANADKGRQRVRTLFAFLLSSLIQLESQLHSQILATEYL